MAESAPLISIPQAPAPANGAAEWFDGHGGARLRAALFQPGVPPRGSVVLSPGRTEPIEKYFEAIEDLQGRGFVVLAHDWRGHGFSGRLLADPLKGHAKGWRPFVGDFDRLLTHFTPRLPRPWIAVGHSMGGGLTTLALAEGETRFQAVVLSAPMLGVRTDNRPPEMVRRWAELQRWTGRGSSYVRPNPADQLDDRFEDNILTHDAARWSRWQAQLRAAPEMQLGPVTWGWLAFALELVRRIERSGRIDRLAVPLTIVAAGEEKLCINASSEAVARRAPQGRYVEVEGAFHEILMETDVRRNVFWREFDAVADRVAPRG